MRKKKTVSLDVEKDKELIKRIEKFRDKNGLSTFVAAVRQLCDDALTLKKISK